MSNREVMQQALDALEKLRVGLLTMREHAESYGESWARAYVKEYREMLPGSAEEQFRALNTMQHRLADVAEGVIQGYDAITALKAALAEPQEPVGWMRIEQPYPQGSELDILMGDGSILCAVFPQADGDLWWSGSGTGEKFIDPRYANVTHWRIHSDTHPAPQRQPLTDEEIADVVVEMNGNEPTAQFWRDLARAIEAAHGIGGQDDTR